MVRNRIRRISKFCAIDGPLVECSVAATVKDDTMAPRFLTVQSIRQRDFQAQTVEGATKSVILSKMTRTRSRRVVTKAPNARHHAARPAHLRARAREMNILQPLADRQVFAQHFRGSPWDAWKVFLAPLFALPMTPDQLEIYRKHIGRSASPTNPFHEAWLRVRCASNCYRVEQAAMTRHSTHAGPTAAFLVVPPFTYTLARDNQRKERPPWRAAVVGRGQFR
jgi:hypothetical protein